MSESMADAMTAGKGVIRRSTDPTRPSDMRVQSGPGREVAVALIRVGAERFRKMKDPAAHVRVFDLEIGADEFDGFPAVKEARFEARFGITVTIDARRRRYGVDIASKKYWIGTSRACDRSKSRLDAMRLRPCSFFCSC